MNVARSYSSRAIETILGSSLLLIGVVGLVLLSLGWIIHTGRVAGFLAIYGGAFLVFGAGSWVGIKLFRRASRRR